MFGPKFFILFIYTTSIKFIQLNGKPLHKSEIQSSVQVAPLDQIQTILKFAEAFEVIAEKVLPLLTKVTMAVDQTIDKINPHLLEIISGAEKVFHLNNGKENEYKNTIAFISTKQLLQNNKKLKEI